MSMTDIREHMAVLGSDDEHVGTVDFIDASGQVVLTKADSSDGKHHILDAELIDHVDENVHLNVTASEAMDELEETDDTLELEEDDDEELGEDGDIDDEEEEE